MFKILTKEGDNQEIILQKLHSATGDNFMRYS